MNTVELENISKHFGALKANDNISFTFEAQKIYAILGENGAGKSTLMKILSGFQAPTAGILRIDDEPVVFRNPNDAIHHRIGMLYQDPLDYAPLTALENFLLGRAQRFLLERRDGLRSFNAQCKRLGFALDPYALIAEMTVAERQQLEIVRLLSLGVRFLILDEPTTGISSERKQMLFDTLKSLAYDDKLLIALVSHKLDDVQALCDEVIVLQRGKMVGHRTLPTPDHELIQLMFGKLIEKQATESIVGEETILDVQKLPIETPLFTIPGIDLEVKEGEVIGLAGLDGSGQVAFMKRIIGLQRLTMADHMFALATLVISLLVLVQVLGESRELLQLAGGLLALLILPPIVQRVWVAWQEQAGNAAASDVRLNHRSIKAYSYRALLKHGITYLPSGRTEEGLVRDLTVMEHLALARYKRYVALNWLRIWKHAGKLVQRFNVKGRPLDAIQNLSGGNQQRVALGLLPEQASVILMDNPTRGLDVESAQYIWSLLLARRQHGTSIIFSSPDLDEILNYSDRIMVFASETTTLIDDPTQMTSDYLGELIGGKTLA